MSVISYLQIISRHLISEKCLHDVLVGQQCNYVIRMSYFSLDGL
jgi:hypothetical protein